MADVIQEESHVCFVKKKNISIIQGLNGQRLVWKTGQGGVVRAPVQSSSVAQCVQLFATP